MTTGSRPPAIASLTASASSRLCSRSVSAVAHPSARLCLGLVRRARQLGYRDRPDPRAEARFAESTRRTPGSRLGAGSIRSQAHAPRHTDHLDRQDAVRLAIVGHASPHVVSYTCKKCFTGVVGAQDQIPSSHGHRDEPEPDDARVPLA